MEQTSILTPLVGTMLLTLLVWIYMGVRRIPFIVRAKLTPQQLRPLELARLAPPSVATPADNFRNLCELPTIFYAVVLYLFVAQQVDATYVVAAWIFFAFRILHSIVHCTFNFIPLRFAVYVISGAALWFMVLRIAYAVILQP